MIAPGVDVHGHHPRATSRRLGGARLHTLTNDEVRRLIEVAAEVHEMAPLAFRLAAEAGARRGGLAALRWDKFVDNEVVVDRQIIGPCSADSDPWLPLIGLGNLLAGRSSPRELASVQTDH